MEFYEASNLVREGKHHFVSVEIPDGLMHHMEEFVLEYCDPCLFEGAENEDYYSMIANEYLNEYFSRMIASKK